MDIKYWLTLNCQSRDHDPIFDPAVVQITNQIHGFERACNNNQRPVMLNLKSIQHNVSARFIEVLMQTTPVNQWNLRQIRSKALIL